MGEPVGRGEISMGNINRRIGQDIQEGLKSVKREMNVRGKIER